MKKPAVDNVVNDVLNQTRNLRHMQVS